MDDHEATCGLQLMVDGCENSLMEHVPIVG